VDKVRYVGEPVAMVIADTRARAQDALETIVLDLEELPVVSDRDDAERGDTLLHEDANTNRAITLHAVRGDADAAFRDAAYTRRERFSMHRHTAIPLETRGLLADWDAVQCRLIVDGAGKVPFANRRILAGMLGLEESAIDMLECDIGGAFGARGEFYPEDFLIPFAARRLGRPVKWVETRSDHFLATSHARDADCDIDLVVEVAGAGLKMLRNDGGNANGMLKLRLLGNRSNASALGVKTELSAGGWHGLRSVQTLPVEIGVGKRKQLDSVSIRWFDTRQDTTEVAVSCEPMSLFELVLPTGSCPYLYTWDGRSNRFVTDILGAAPLGLPVAPGRFIEADPDELVRLGDETDVVPKDGDYVVHLTEELREILYLDQARLVVADRPAGQPSQASFPTEMATN